MSRWDRGGDEDMKGKFGMSKTTVRMDWGIFEWVRSTLGGYGHVMRMN